MIIICMNHTLIWISNFTHYVHQIHMASKNLVELFLAKNIFRFFKNLSQFKGQERKSLLGVYSYTKAVLSHQVQTTYFQFITVIFL